MGFGELWEQRVVWWRWALGSAVGFSIAVNAAVAPKELHIGNGAEPRDLDPHLTTGVPESHLAQNLFEALVSKDPRTLEPVPGIAESWSSSKDGLVWTFKLRKDAKWSDGSPLTAEDYVYSWTRLLEPKTASEYAYQAHYIKNGKPYNEGKLKDAKQLGIKAIDANTLQVTLDNPTPFFIALLYHHSLYAVPKHVIEKFGARWTRPENMVSNGPFKLEKWEVNKIITMVPNPNYWDRKTVKLDRVFFYPIDKTDTEEKLFRAKKLHITETIPLEKLPFWQADKTGVFQLHPYLGVYHYWINTRKKPLDNKLVRQALALAIDRDSIVKFVTKGGQAPATFFVPPGTGGYQPKAVLPPDGSQVTKAQELLAKAGYPGGKGFPKFELLFNTQDGHRKIAEAVQQMWKKNLGIEAQLVNQEWKVYLDNTKTGNYFIARQGWIGDYNDPNTFLDMFMTDNGNNRSGWGNKQYDSLIEKAAKERDQKKRLGYFAQAEAILLDELPIIPIYIYTRTYLKRPEVAGWFPNIEDVHPLKHVSLP